MPTYIVNFCAYNRAAEDGIHTRGSQEVEAENEEEAAEQVQEDWLQEDIDGFCVEEVIEKCEGTSCGTRHDHYVGVVESHDQYQALIIVNDNGIDTCFMPPVTTAKGAAYIHDLVTQGRPDWKGQYPLNHIELTIEEKAQLLDEFLYAMSDPPAWKVKRIREWKQYDSEETH
jgi:hypothetical protein